MEQDELLRRREEIVRRISILEWDKERQQIHQGHAKHLEILKQELIKIDTALKPEHSVVFDEEE